MLGIGATNRQGDIVRFQRKAMLEPGQITVVGKGMYTSAKFAPERMRVAKLHRAGAGAPDVGDHDLAGDPVTT
jgi:hypothetical protein